jgi:hypothetical protein
MASRIEARANPELLARRASEPVYALLRDDSGGQPALVSRIFVSWNQIAAWLRRVDSVRRAA